VKYEMGRRIMAYCNDFEDIQILVSVDPDKYSEEEHDDLCKWLMRAVVAYRGFLKNEQKIGEIAGLVAFGIPARLTKFMKGLEQKVREAFGYALALVLGFDEYERAMNFTPDDLGDLPDDLPQGFFIPFDRKNPGPGGRLDG